MKEKSFINLFLAALVLLCTVSNTYASTPDGYDRITVREEIPGGYVSAGSYQDDVLGNPYYKDNVHILVEIEDESCFHGPFDASDRYGDIENFAQDYNLGLESGPLNQAASIGDIMKADDHIIIPTTTLLADYQ